MTLCVGWYANVTAILLARLIIERLKKGYETAQLPVLSPSLTISFCTPCCSPIPLLLPVSCLTACACLSQVSSSLNINSFLVNSHSEHLRKLSGKLVTIPVDRAEFKAFRATQPASIGGGVVDTSPGRKGAASVGPVGPVASGKKRKDAGE